ncbi:MAG: oligoendopeptidase F [Rhodospirillaceae bacterium]
MHRWTSCVALAITLSFAHANAAEAPNPKYVWDLSELYPSDTAWESERAAIANALPGLSAYKGTLGRDAATLARALRAISEINRRLDRLETYAGLKHDEDTRIGANQLLTQKGELLHTEFDKATSYLNPELVALGRTKVEELIAADPALKVFAYRLRNTLRRAEHTLGDEAEGVLAAAGALSTTPDTTYSLLANADIPWPTVTLADGTTKRLDSQGYAATRDVQNRDDRRRVFDAFFGTWSKFRNSVGATLGGSIHDQVFKAKARHYDTGLAAALAANNVPDTVYKTLVAETNAALPVIYRYYAIRKRMLKVDQLHYYDMYVPLVSSKAAFTPEAGEKLVLEAIAPLGRDYAATLARGFGSRWMHLYPQPGKRSGAYMNPGAYDVHPYLLINYTDDYDGVSTVAHEWGHAMHSLLANKAQPYETADYPIFLAEIASTTNEMLLQDYVIAHAKTPQEKLYYLNEALELIRGTFYRQTMFAEFELKTHEAAERGEPLTGEVFDKIYLDLLKRYFGDAEGVVKIDDAYASEWAYIPHFYNDFYVYQYATSIAAAAYFAKGVESGGAKARDNYLNVLKAGGSDYPTEILKRAGLDLSDPAPYRALVARTAAIIDQMEALTRSSR